MKRLSYNKYAKRKGRAPVITHFQPQRFGVFESDAERKKWTKALAKSLGHDIDGLGFTWGDPTFSGDIDRNDRVGDDCAE